MAVGFVASATSGSQASVASFNIGTLGTGARAGIVFVCVHNSATDIITGVTWNGVAMVELFKATDTDTEPGVVKAYFLDNVTNGTITVSRTNNATVTVGYAASISAASACGVWQTITRVSSTQNTNANTSTTGTGASGEVAVDDGGRPTNSMRFAAAYTGAASPILAGTNSTLLQSLDSTALGSSFVRETNAGTGSRNVGFATGTTDDYAAVFVAVSEINVSATGSITTAVQTVSGTGVETFTATGAVGLAATTVSGTAQEVFTATGAATLQAVSVTGTGDHTESSGPSGTGAPAVAAVTVTGSGEIRLTGTGASSLPATTVAGTGVLSMTATGAVGLSAVTVSGTGIGGISGTATIGVPSPVVAGSGTSTGGIVLGHGGRTARRRPVVVVAPPVDDEEAILVLEGF